MQHRVDDVEVRQHGALGPASGAGGVENDRCVVLVDIRRRRRGRRLGEFAEWHGARRFTANDKGVLQAGQPLARRQPVGEAGFEQQHLGAAVVEHVFQRRCLLADVDGDGDGAETRRRHDRADVLTPIGHQDGDAVASRDAQGGKIAGDAVYLIVQVAVGQARFALHHRLAFGAEGDGLGEHLIEAGGTVREALHAAVAEMRFFADFKRDGSGPGHRACFRQRDAVKSCSRGLRSARLPGRSRLRARHRDRPPC